MDLLGLLGGSDFAGTNGPDTVSKLGRRIRLAKDSPDRLVGNDNLRPVLDGVRHSLQLLGHDSNSAAGLPLLQALTTAENNAQSAISRGLCLASDERIVLLQDYSSLRVSKDRPGDTAVFELVGRDLAREGTIRLVEDVLGCNFDV